MPKCRALLRSPLFLHVRLLVHVAPRLFAVGMILAVSRSAALVAVMISSGRLIGALSDAVADGDDARTAWMWLMVFAASFVAGALLGAASRGVEELISARYLGGYQDLLLDTATAPSVVTGLQSDSGSIALDRAADVLQHWLFLRGVSGIWGMISNRVAGVGALVIVTAWHWWLAALLLASWLLLSRAIARWRGIVFDDTEQQALPMRHRAAYLNRLLAARSSAKEVRLFGLADWLFGYYVDLSRTAMTMVAGRRGEGVRRTVLPLLLLLIMHAGAFAVLISDAAAGLVSVAGLATLVQTMLGMSALGRQDDDETSTGRTATELARLVAFRTSLGLPFPAAPPARPTPASTRAVPASIEIRGLRFGYPGHSELVLDGVDLLVEPGECVAIVGANGAGKSTLLSLLCGLWRPDAGLVRIDGLDPTMDRSARSRVAPVFQTFLRLPLSAKENITAGNAWRAGTEWRGAAADASADQVVAGLTAHAETVLSSQFPGGTDLSGGQWQRVALARALTAVHAGTGVLALDEPTAALDVRAEIALFESVLRASGQVTTLLITHRLSSVRHADRIVVLGRPAEGGGARVIENGSHQELIQLGGSYAEMFNLQAARFNGASR